MVGKLAVEISGNDEKIENSIILINPSSPDSDPEVIINSDQRKEMFMLDWEFSPNGEFILFVTSYHVDPIPVYRHSAESNYGIYSVKTGIWDTPWGNRSFRVRVFTEQK